MSKLEEMVPLLTAVISAIALLTGYVVQKHQEQNEETLKTRQEIYSDLISNITERNEIQGRIEMSPEGLKATSPEEKSQLYLRNPEFQSNEGARTRIVALLCLYGTDKAVNAYAQWAAEETEPNGNGGNLGELILRLRESLVSTKITENEANLAIWYNRKYLEKPAPAR